MFNYISYAVKVLLVVNLHKWDGLHFMTPYSHVENSRQTTSMHNKRN